MLSSKARPHLLSPLSLGTQKLVYSSPVFVVSSSVPSKRLKATMQQNEQEQGFGRLFNTQGQDYAKYRPHYPDELYEDILRFGGWSPSERKLALDLGCGTGQGTHKLAVYFEKVIGTDPSGKQLESAVQKDNVTYRKGISEEIDMPDASLDLLSSAQAAHWFDLPKFYKEAQRVLKKNGVVALWGYSICQLDNPEAHRQMQNYHFNILGPYWEKERALVDAGYKHIQLPFPRTERKDYNVEKIMQMSHFIGYMNTFSGLKTMRERNPTIAEDPLQTISRKLMAAYGTNDPSQCTMKVTYPMFLLLGQKQ